MRTIMGMSCAAALRLPLAVALIIGALAAPSAHASAFPTGALPCFVDRVDSLGWVWDTTGEGAIDHGDGDAVDEPPSGVYDGGFDYYPSVKFDGGFWFPSDTSGTCGRALAGREVTTAEAPVGADGLIVQRSVYVPRTGQAFARLRTAITNPTADPITKDIQFYGKLDSQSADALSPRGSGEAPGIIDATLTVDDRWFAADMTDLTDLTDPLADPGNLTLIDGFGTPSDLHDAQDLPTTPDPDVITWDYDDVTVPAGATLEYVQFAGQRDEALPYQLDADAIYRASDEQWAGMSAAERARVRNWDAREPDTTITGGPTTTNDDTPAFTFTGTLGPSQFECRVRPAQTTFSSCSSGGALATLSDGSYTLDVRSRRTATLVFDESPATRAFTVDTDPPAASITDGPSGRQASTSATFALAADEPGATIFCRIRPIGTYAVCPASTSFPVLSSDDYTLDVYAVDTAGNQSPVISRSFTVDAVAPDTTLTATPPALSSDTTPTFAFSSEPGATFQCRIGTSEPFESCSSPLTQAPLDDGSYTMQVRAVDDVANVDATAAAFGFTIDTTAPRTTISSGPSGRVASSTASFEFLATGSPTLYECSLDGVGFTGCVSPLSHSQLADGQHTLDVRARDAAGNVETPAVRRAWTVDVTPPDTALTLVPASTSSDTTPTFGFTSGEPSTFVCSLDGGSFDACASPLTAAPLGDGDHTFAVAAVDDLANTDPGPATVTFAIDTAPSTTVITSGPTGPIAVREATFAFSAPGAASYQCRLVGQDYAPCPDSASYTDLADGPYTFQVRAVDAAGNVENPPASRSFVVDTTGPDTAITGGPGAVTTDPTPEVVFTSPEPGASFRCVLDGGAPVACGLPLAPAALADGPHTISVAAVDALGNADPTPATTTFRVDTTAPVTTVVTAPPASSTSVVADFTFAASEDAVFECRIVPAVFAACPSPLKLGPLEPGTYELEVRARDAAGLLDATPAVSRFTVLAPVSAASSPGAAPAVTDVPPVLSDLKVRAKCSRSRVRNASFRLSEDADVRFVLLRRRSPAWKHCPSVRDGLREDRAPVSALGGGSLAFDEGTNTQPVAASGRARARAGGAAGTTRLIDASKLAPGTYVLVAVARDAAGGQSAQVSAKFWVLTARPPSR